MSQGDFVRTRYETDNGEVCNCRLQPETLEATFGTTANAAPTTAVTQLASAIARKGKREIGVGMRLIGISNTPDADGYTSEVLYVPVLRKATYDSANLGAAATYNGITGVVVSKIPESIR